MKSFLILSIGFLCVFSASARSISIEQAEQVAHNVFIANSDFEQSEIGVKSVLIEKMNTDTVFYFVEMLPEGFVIVSADDKVFPVLAYGFEPLEKNQPQPIAYLEWMHNRGVEILDMVQSQREETEKVKQAWKKWLSKDVSQSKSKSLAPLLLTEWNQDAHYNADCPLDASGPGGRAYAGCVAVSMAQVMYYYKYPQQGTGSHSYYSSYGMLNANFGATTYDWDEMINEIAAFENPAIAELLSHLGISVEMNYSANGSGAYMTDATAALKDYFGYQSATTLLSKDAYVDSTWLRMIRDNLDAQMPMMYSGYPSLGAGHAFNLDGYQGDDYFHFNWGWSGSYNGYFYLGTLNPGGYDFSHWQRGVFNIYPGSASYPYGCQGFKILNTTEGSLYDGSAFLDYESNSVCSWLIQPNAMIENIELSFDYVELDAGDYIIIYDGADASANVIDTVTGTSVPGVIVSTGPELYVEFTSDQVLEMDGFHATYTSNFPTYCKGIKTITTPTGTLNDGSDTNDYVNNSFCKWVIQPTGNPSVIYLDFNQFDTEANTDVLKIVNLQNNTTVALYSGDQIPPSLAVNTNSLMLMFTSNSQVTASGWELSYYTDLTSQVDELESECKIYPNPAKQVVTIENNRSLKDIHLEIYNMSGQRLMFENIDVEAGIPVHVELKDLSEGVYFIVLKNRQYLHREKLIVQ